ncbi:MAG: four helix bundle protein [Bacteroidetes bacterium]|nr:four helix bundle protein [Bacteroidota bacterium]
MKKYDLEQRLIDFAVNVISISAGLENSKAGSHLGTQLLRSGTAPALNYGEAQSAESRRDFVHKMKIVLKELRETLVALKIIERACLTATLNQLEPAKKECNELIAICVKSIETAIKNMNLAAGN